jgi:hypothetical protein
VIAERGNGHGMESGQSFHSLLAVKCSQNPGHHR